MLIIESPRLTQEQAAAASFDERFASIVPWLKKYIAATAGRWAKRQVANYSPEDVFHECYIELRVKNHLFDPTRSNYLGFARRLVVLLLPRLRDRSLTVELPRDSSFAERQYRKAVDAGEEVSAKRRETFERIQGARVQFYLSPVAVVAGDGDDEFVPRDRPARRLGGDIPVDATLGLPEDRQPPEPDPQARRQLAAAIGHLSPIEARMVGSLYGLWGRPRLTNDELAGELGVSINQVRSVRRRALEKIKRRLLASGHRAVASDN